MAWRASGRTNSELIANLASHGVLKSEIAKPAMARVDRANYVRDRSSAYEDAPQRIGYGATISAPHMVRYLLAIFHHIVGESGKVVGIEHVPELVDWAIENLRKDGLGDALDAKQIEVLVGDGRQGCPEKGPYDAIHVGAAAPNVPSSLVEHLASPGRMFIPVGVYMQDVLQVDKDQNGGVTQQPIMSVSYVPLTDRDKQGDW
ncbi:hypothetical protein M378DRAFT_187020 [Amanita muscaria Koide BX008]|uniref:protein-L-isoaspartate(D-aspartate) O-methyltransferase n=1 Tax=Amanita muscaria (strain Koide BX008) TaxID=946122 RepID=A0A0C2X2M2_AMAMK|nr:hypothetical protein M378DRAFT_187020 [Amanita muscaria Koide BX008]